jgi:M6 family metalloprotease-like protein
MFRNRISLTIIICAFVVYPALTKDKAKNPIFHKSSISNRFVSSHNSGTTKAVFFADLPDTLKILAIRVQFQKDNDRGSTGNGWFDLAETDSAILNPPPHNQLYFANQLRALKDYYEKVSQGKLILDITDSAGNFTVFPREADSVWTLSQPMSYYNPNTTDEELDQRLSELFSDAIKIADQNSAIDFSEFDVYLVFHAGVGAEFSQDFDTTPNDIPSVFLNFNDLKNTIGSGGMNFQGIEVNDGNFFVKEGIILPETENQGGYEFGILGTAVIMFGHQLGLPNLYDSDTGHPGIGRFGIMDQGSGSFSGLLPVHPCAWSKIFLGWEEPVTITSGEQFPVAASLATDPNKIYKIPVNAKEYFLIENRQKNVLKNRDVAIGYDENGVRIEFNDNGEINLPAGQNKIGVIVEVDEYDFGLPGSGILIWHIDENIIEQHYQENRVNADMYHRGVDLVEADGAQDIGYFFNFFGITGYDAGSAYDMWWNDNGDFKYANSSEAVAFTPNTMPASNSWTGANTGIYLTDFSKSDSVMYFSLELKKNQQGFPVYLGNNSGKSPTVSGDLDGDGLRELIAATENGQILAWRSNGEKFLDNDDVTSQVNINGDTTFVSLAVFAELENGSFTFAPSLADLDNDGKLEVIAASSDGRLLVWKSVDPDNNGRADLFMEFNTEDELFSTVPVVGDFTTVQDNAQIAIGSSAGQLYIMTQNELQGSVSGNVKSVTFPSGILALAAFSENSLKGLVVVCDNGSVHFLEEGADIKWSRAYTHITDFNYPAVGDLNRDGNLEIVLTSNTGDLLIIDKEGNEPEYFSPTSLNGHLSNPTLADINSNGYLDVVFTGGGKIFAFNYKGISLTNFPIEYEQSESNISYPDPVLADIDGDGFTEIIVSSEKDQLLIFDSQGRKNLGFPISVSGSVVANIGTADLTNNNKFDLFARSKDDYCYAWSLEFDYSADQVFWGEFLLNHQHTSLFTSEISKPATQGELMPVKSVYNYPNPTEGKTTTIRYYLRKEANVSIKIYDMAGELVEEMPGGGLPEINNEVIWDITNVESGVYLARVKAEAGGESNMAIIKIAVVK